MRAAVTAAVAALLAFSAAPELAHAQGSIPNTAPIFPSTSSMDRPHRVHVLPVVWIPSNNAGTATSSYVTKAQTNLGIHLRTAREKYRSMLRSPVTGASRGTFEIATWDAAINRARPFFELSNTLQPLVVQSDHAWSDIPWVGGDPAIVADVLTAAGCKVQSCPFVFVILVHHAGASGIYGTPFHYGFNGGGGFVHVPIDIAHDSYTMNLGSEAVSFQSTLLHELGHAFGLAHMSTYSGMNVTHDLPDGCTDSSTCPLSAYDAYCDPMPWARERIEFHCSPSIMSYSKRNQTRGCPATDGAGTCVMPSAAQIAAIPGMLLSENLNNLARNSLVFPELAADFDLQYDDDDGDGNVQWHPGFAYPDKWANVIPNHPQFTASSPYYSEEGTAGRMAFGQNWRSIAPIGTPYHDWRMWRSIPVDPYTWVWIDFTFPQNVQLGRVRVYTGLSGGADRALEVEMRSGNAGTTWQPLCAASSLGGAHDGEVQGYSWCAPARLHRIRLKAGSSGRVVVRMIRFFDMNGKELFAPAEPIASSPTTHMGGYYTDPNNVVGGEQVIMDYTSGFDADRMWHSKQLDTAGEWLWFDVRLPEKLALTSVVVYTGHSGYYHRADRIQVWVRDEDRLYQLRGDSYATSAAQATVAMPGIEGRHLRIWLRSTATPATKHVVIRGIRFFTAQGEVFVPRSGYSGIAPVL